MRVLAILTVSLLASAVQAGKLETRKLRSEALEREVQINILLPDGYESETDRRYPVIYLLHGYGGDYTEWARVGIAEESKGLGVIIVMPEGDQSFYVNHHGDPRGRWEDYITGEVVRFTEENYRTLAGREGRGISGLSMGGFGAILLGLRHPDLFASISSHSGALGVPEPVGVGPIDERIGKIFGPEDSRERRIYDIRGLARDLPAVQRPDIYIDCGSQDPLLESNRSFVAYLSDLKAPYEYREVPGAHNFAYWKRNVRYSLEHQLAALEQARAAGPPAAPRVDVSGPWRATALMPSGQEAVSLLTLKQDGESVSGRAEWPNGSMELSRGSFKDGKLLLEVDVEREEQKGVIRVEARFQGERLLGWWKVVREGNEEVFEGEWSAVAEEPAQGKDPDLAPILGEWELVAEFQDYKLDYTLRLALKDKALRAILVSPRSGEHPAKAATFKDGVLRIEIDRTYNGNEVTLVYEGKLAGEGLSGTVVPVGLPDVKGTWKAEKKAEPER